MWHCYWGTQWSWGNFQDWHQDSTVLPYPLAWLGSHMAVGISILCVANAINNSWLQDVSATYCTQLTKSCLTASCDQHIIVFAFIHALNDSYRALSGPHVTGLALSHAHLNWFQNRLNETCSAPGFSWNGFVETGFEAQENGGVRTCMETTFLEIWNEHEIQRQLQAALPNPDRSTPHRISNDSICDNREHT